MNTSIVSLCNIPEGTCSLPGVGNIDLRRLLEKSSSKMYFHVDICDGYLSITEKQVGMAWARFLAVARNCHEQNVELKKSHDGFILRMTRPVKASEELFVWIGADLLSELEFPFLKPVNIKGNQAYHCHKCGCIFQNPNPLKVHLSFQCKSSETHISVGIPIDSSLDDEFQMRSFEMDKPLGNLGSKTSIMNGISVPLLLLPNSHSTSIEMFPHFHSNTSQTLQELKSYNIPEHTKTVCSNVSFELRISQDSPSGLAASSSNMWIDHSSQCTMPSSGYVCAYCGKVYSRKYGLKIHVRTHTGYKPLKCRYCFRPFSDPSNLNKHVRLHSESDTPYRCSICGKVLVRRRDLQRHMKSRHQEDSLEDNK